MSWSPRSSAYIGIISFSSTRSPDFKGRELLDEISLFESGQLGEFIIITHAVLTMAIGTILRQFFTLGGIATSLGVTGCQYQYEQGCEKSFSG